MQDDPMEELRKMFQGSTSTSDDNTWLISARDKLYSMFRSPMKEEYTHEAFRWVARLCLTMHDFSWISQTKKWNLDEGKIFSCFAMLSFSEIQILLPIMQRHLTCGDEIDVDGGKVMARPPTTEEYDRFTDHLIIMESVIKTLLKNESDEDTNSQIEMIQAKDMKSLLKILKETVFSICDYLEVVNKYWADVVKDKEGVKFTSALGALRIVCVWLSEEPYSLVTQCKSYLIDLILKNLLMTDQSIMVDLLVMALHSVCTTDDELSVRLKQHPDHKEALEKYLIHVQRERSLASNDRRQKKTYILRCGLVKDLLS